MVKIFRATDPAIVFLMHFFGDDCSNEKEDRNSLAGLMIDRPGDVCVIVGIDDGIVCHVCGKRDENWVWVYNAWSKVESKHSAECFEMIKNWTKSLGINQLRCETYHRPEVMNRAFGWEKYSTIMKLDLGIVQ